MSSLPSAPLKPGAVERLLGSPDVTDATRRVLEARLATSSNGAPRVFDEAGFAVLRAVTGRLIPQAEGRGVDLAGRLDARLADEPGKGWRYDALPPEREAMTRGVAGIDKAARARFGTGFADLQGEQQDAVLQSVQTGEAQTYAFAGLDQTRFFGELLAALAELYFSHPFASERIGFVGMADARGFQALGLNARDPIEDEASFAPL